ncbi:MAG: hypothetical protein H0U23_13150, partial [Blastocatellia bacterium]|nr:hypothetical protein [Blastocatellia bacterium]
MTPKFLITVLTILCCSSARAFNADNAAKTVRSDGTVADTQAAINYMNGKNQDGWVVTIGEPGGSYVWSATEMNSIQVGGEKTYTLQGASPTNRPTISLDTAFSLYYGSTGQVTTVKDIIFTENPPGRSPAFFVGGSGPTPGFRFTNVRWQGVFNSTLFLIGNPGGSGGTRGEGPFGLFDNCSGNSVTQFNIYGNNGGTDDQAVSPSWRLPIEWGTAKAVYFEDCDFRSSTWGSGAGLTDAYNGGSFVFRYNRLENIVLLDHGPDHFSTKVKSVLKHEVMHNEFYYTAGSAVPWMVFFRGGTAAIFDNTFNTTSGSATNQGIFWDYFR